MAGPRRRWTRAHAARLFGRAGFGASPKEIVLWAHRSRERAIDWQADELGSAPAEPGHAAKGMKATLRVTRHRT